MLVRKYSLLTFVCFVSYFLFGFIDNMKGATLSSVLDEMHFSYTSGANIVLSEYFGFVIATLLTGIIADILGKKSVMVIAGFFLFIGAAGYSLSQSINGFLCTFFLVGIGCGALELGGSVTISDLYGEGRGKYLNLLSCFHGVGSMVVPLFVSQIATRGYTWRTSYRWSLGLVALFLLFCLITKFPGLQPVDKKNNAPANSRRKIFSKRVIYLFVVMFSYVATEIGLATWLANFLIKEKALSFTLSSAYLSLYFASIMIGRFVGSFVVGRVGYLRIMLYCGCGAIITLVLGIYGSAPLSIFIPLTGLFYAILFPTTTALVSDSVVGKPGTALGLLFCCGGIGGMIGPWLSGIVNDTLGLRYGMSINIIFCLIIVLTIGLLHKLDKSSVKTPSW